MDFTFDERSRLLTCSADAALKDLESACAERSLVLGYVPAKKTRTVRDALLRRVPNRLSERYGELDDLCVSIAVRRNGRMMRTKNVPRSATGPDFKKLLCASSRFGTAVEVTLRVSPKPEAAAGFRIRWRQKAASESFLRLFWASGIRPAFLERKGGDAVDLSLEGLSEIVQAEILTLRSMVRETGGRIHARS